VPHERAPRRRVTEREVMRWLGWPGQPVRPPFVRRLERAWAPHVARLRRCALALLGCLLLACVALVAAAVAGWQLLSGIAALVCVLALVPLGVAAIVVRTLDDAARASGLRHRMLPDLPTVAPTSRGLMVGDVWPKLIPWWQIEELDRSGPRWRVRWRCGGCALDPDDPDTAALGRGIDRILAARREGWLLPGEPERDDLPDTALSLARLVGDEGHAEKGLTRVDE